MTRARPITLIVEKLQFLGLTSEADELTAEE
jgi:hypothetical protein